jgi:hypothetical protein
MRIQSIQFSSIGLLLALLSGCGGVDVQGVSSVAQSANEAAPSLRSNSQQVVQDLPNLERIADCLHCAP